MEKVYDEQDVINFYFAPGSNVVSRAFTDSLKC